MFIFAVRVFILFHISMSLLAASFTSEEAAALLYTYKQSIARETTVHQKKKMVEQETM